MFKFLIPAPSISLEIPKDAAIGRSEQVSKSLPDIKSGELLDVSIDPRKLITAIFKDFI